MKRQKHTLEEVKAHYKACAKALAGQTLDWQNIQKVFSIKEKVYNYASASKLVEIGVLIPRYTETRTVRAGRGTRQMKVQLYNVRVEDINWFALWGELKRLRERNNSYNKTSREHKLVEPVKKSVDESINEPIKELVDEPINEPVEIRIIEHSNELYEAIKVIKCYGGKIIFG